MYQAASEAAEAVSNDIHSTAHQDAFKKALSVCLKDLVLRTEAALMQGRVEEFHQLCNFRVPLGVGVNSLPDIQSRGSRSSAPLPVHLRPMGPSPPCPPPITTVNQFRPAMFQFYTAPLKSFVAWHRNAPDLIDQPSLPIYRGTIAHH
jgi:hypothetical protein